VDTMKFTGPAVAEPTAPSAGPGRVGSLDGFDLGSDRAYLAATGHGSPEDTAAVNRMMAADDVPITFNPPSPLLRLRTPGKGEESLLRPFSSLSEDSA